MIVTCDHCGARYKLDDSRISGRGAKITCPRCRHVFVVYKDRPGGAAAPGGAPEVTERALSTPPPDAAPSNQRDVDSLDFRKVGIQSWKVKVKIGLVYDFSDYKTLSKYISDGRVTSTDLLSHDGTEWTPIGDISDLKQHFVDVYCAAEAALQAESDEAAQNDVGDFDDDDAPTHIMGMDDLAGNLGAERATQAAGGFSTAQLGGLAAAASEVEELFKTGNAEDASPRFVDPFEQRKKSRERKARGGPAGGGAAAASATRSRPHPPAERSRAAQPAPKEGGGSGGMLLVALALLALAGGGYWWKSNQAPATPAATTATAAPTPAPPKQKAKRPPEKEDQPGGIVPEGVGEAVDPATGDDNWGLEEEEPQLIPVVPPEFRSGGAPCRAGPDTPARRRAAAPPLAVARPSTAPCPRATTPTRAGPLPSRGLQQRRVLPAGRVDVSGNGEYGKLGASMLRRDLAGRGGLPGRRRGLRSRTRLPRRPLRPAGRQRWRHQPLRPTSRPVQGTRAASRSRSTAQRNLRPID